MPLGNLLEGGASMGNFLWDVLASLVGTFMADLLKRALKR
jgi:hypothetical protein